jgi:uncharacterized repeat protein (TIGR01451 family)
MKLFIIKICGMILLLPFFLKAGTCPITFQYTGYMAWEWKDNGDLGTNPGGITSIYALYDNTNVCLYGATQTYTTINTELACTTLAAGEPWHPLAAGHRGYYLKVVSDKPVLMEAASIIQAAINDRQTFLHASNASYQALGGQFYTYLDYNRAASADPVHGDSLFIFNTGSSACVVTIEKWNGSAWVFHDSATVNSGAVWNRGGSGDCGTTLTDTGHYRVTSGCDSLLVNKNNINASDRDNHLSVAPNASTGHKGGSGTFYGLATYNPSYPDRDEAIVVTGWGPGNSTFNVECYSPSTTSSCGSIAGIKDGSNVVAGSWTTVVTGQTVAEGEHWWMNRSAVCGDSPHRVVWTAGGEINVIIGAGVSRAWGDGDYLPSVDGPEHIPFGTEFSFASAANSEQVNWISAICPEPATITLEAYNQGDAGARPIEAYRNAAGNNTMTGGVNVFSQTTTGVDQAVNFKVSWNTAGQNMRVTTTSPCYVYMQADSDPIERAYTSVTPYILISDLAITKTANVTSAVAGDLITYTIQYANLGNSPIANVTLWDTFPDELIFISANPPQDSGLPNPLVWDLGTVDAFYCDSIEVVAQVPDPFCVDAPTRNYASIWGDPTQVPNIATDYHDVDIVGAPVCTIVIYPGGYGGTGWTGETSNPPKSTIGLTQAGENSAATLLRNDDSGWWHVDDIYGDYTQITSVTAHILWREKASSTASNHFLFFDVSTDGTTNGTLDAQLHDDAPINADPPTLTSFREDIVLIPEPGGGWNRTNINNLRFNLRNRTWNDVWVDQVYFVVEVCEPCNEPVPQCILTLDALSYQGTGWPYTSSNAPSTNTGIDADGGTEARVRNDQSGSWSVDILDCEYTQFMKVTAYVDYRYTAA